MAVFNAKCGDDAVDGLADRDALLAQCQVILRGSKGQFSATCVEDHKLQQILFESTKLSTTYNPLQDFAKDQAGQADFLVGNCLFQPNGLAIDSASQRINPDGSINDHHAFAPALTRYSFFALDDLVQLSLFPRQALPFFFPLQHTALTHGVQVTLPLNLAKPLEDAFLLFELNNLVQGSLHQIGR